MRRLSLPELLFFVVVFQKRAEAACDNLSTGQELEDLLKTASTLPFSLSSQLSFVNQKHYCSLVTDILLEAYVERCGPASAYDPYSNTFQEKIVKRNNSSIKCIKELQKIYLKETCGVITQTYNLAVSYEKQLIFLQELYQSLVKSFNTLDQSKKDPFAHLLQKSKSSSDSSLPRLSQPALLLFLSKGNAAGLPKDFEEMKLLETMTNQQKKLPSIEIRRRHISEESRISEEESGNSRSLNSETFANMKKKKQLEGKESKGIKSKDAQDIAGQKRKGRPRKAEAFYDEIQKTYRMKLKALDEKPALEDAQRTLALEKKNAFKRLENAKRNEYLENAIEEALEWRRKFESASGNNNYLKLGKLADEIDRLSIRIPEMAKVLEMKKDWDIWVIKMEDVDKRLKKKVSNIFTEIDKMVPYEDVKEVIDGRKKVRQMDYDSRRVAELERKLESIDKLRDKIVEAESSRDFSKAKDLERQLKDTNISIPEIKILQEKVKNLLSFT